MIPFLAGIIVGIAFACIFFWPIADCRGYERRGREEAEHVEGILNQRR